MSKTTVARRCERFRVEMNAILEFEAPSGRSTGLRTSTLDLGRLGIGILSPVRVEAGRRLRIAVEDRRSGCRRVLHWHGRVVYAREEAGGHRLGIEFTAPEVGPGVSIRCPREGGRTLLLRIDPPWGMEAGVDREPRPEPEPSPRPLATRGVDGSR